MLRFAWAFGALKVNIAVHVAATSTCAQQPQRVVED